MKTKKNQRKLIVSEWMTLDGVFENAIMDQWFTPYDSDERAQYIKESMMESDIFLLGHTTYEMLAPYWSHAKNNEMGIVDKMNSIAKYVVSSTPLKAQWNNTTVIQENVFEEIAMLKQQPGQDIRLSGSATLVHSLLSTDLIDEYRFLVHPIIMGRGKRFFREGMDMTRMKLVKAKTLSLGVVLLCYQPEKGL